VTGQRRIRLFLDSNVLTAGIVSQWALDKAALSLCAARVCKLVLADVVRDEVEENLLIHAAHLPSLKADELIEHYRRLVNRPILRWSPLCFYFRRDHLRPAAKKAGVHIEDGQRFGPSQLASQPKQLASE